MSLSSSHADYARVLRVQLSLWAASLALGLAGCLLDTAPLPPSGTHASSSTVTTWDPKVTDVPPEAGMIVTGEGCQPDAQDCPVRCNSDSDCPMTRACEVVTCVDGGCQVDAAACDEDAGVCRAGVAGPCRKCEAGTAECSDEHARRSCDADGRWSEPEACGVMCVAGQCTECAPGGSECVDSKQRRCGDDGRWSEVTACELGCSEGACQECMPGARQCTPTGEARSCDANGRWNQDETCESGCLDGRCRSCREGAKRCNADAQEQCGADGTWQLGAACSLGCVRDHCAACKIGSYECVGLTDQRVCGDDGEWGAPSACLGGCLSGQCSECISGATRCAEAGMQRCSPERRWQTIMACPFGCDGSNCAACAEGAVECTSRTTLRVCRNHAWTAADACRPDAYCDMAAPGGNTCPCDPGYVDPHPDPGLCMPR